MLWPGALPHPGSTLLVALISSPLSHQLQCGHPGTGQEQKRERQRPQFLICLHGMQIKDLSVARDWGQPGPSHDTQANCTPALSSPALSTPALSSPSLFTPAMSSPALSSPALCPHLHFSCLHHVSTPCVHTCIVQSVEGLQAMTLGPPLRSSVLLKDIKITCYQPCLLEFFMICILRMAFAFLNV